jgi:hypothetical protein
MQALNGLLHPNSERSHCSLGVDQSDRQNGLLYSAVHGHVCFQNGIPVFSKLGTIA